MTAYTFDQIIDFTRTSAATYVANTGFVTQTPASRNLLTYTQEFDNAAWAKGTGVTVAANAGVAPDGTQTADNVAFAAGGASQFLRTFPVMTAGLVYTFSIYARLISGTPTFSIDVGNGAAASTAQTPTASWQRFSFTFTFTGSNQWVDIEASAAGTIAFWGAQLEAVPDANLVLGSEIRSTGSIVTVGTVTAGSYNTSTGEAVLPRVDGANINQVVFTSTSGKNYRVDIQNTGAVAISVRSGSTILSTVAAGQRATVYAVVAAPQNLSIWPNGDAATATATIHSVKEITGTVGMPSDYTRNNGGVYPPRFDYDPVTLAPRGLLIEEQRTNLLTYSEQFGNAAWNKVRSVATANAATSPDGTADADKLTEDTSTNSHYAAQFSVNVTSGVAYTYSVFAKAAERSWVALRLEATNGAFNGGVANFNLSAGAVGTVDAGLTATISAVGSGWYRLTVTGTATATAAGVLSIYLASANNVLSYTGDGTSGIYLWGAQLEAGAFATSYIPTVASQVTRTADVAQVTGPNFARWYNQSEGTFVVEYSSSSIALGTVSKGLASANDGSGGNRIYGYVSSTGTLSLLVTNAGSTEGAASFIGAINSNVTNKSAWVYKVNDFAILNNGGTVAADNTGTPPSTPNRLEIGQHLSGNQLNGHIRRIRYYPTRLSNAQLQALTA